MSTKMHQDRFKFTGETKIVKGLVVNQIRACKTFTNKATGWVVNKGDVGGYIQLENCILWTSTGWVFPECVVLGVLVIVDDTTDTIKNKLLGTIGFDTDLYNISTTKKFVKVGCQNHSIKTWRENYKSIADRQRFPESSIPEFLGYLDQIEKFYAEESNNDILENITKLSESLQKSSLKQTDVDTLQTLVSSLKPCESLPEIPVVPIEKVSSGPIRDASGRFAKKS
jgi:hypothetical protein